MKRETDRLDYLFFPPSLGQMPSIIIFPYFLAEKKKDAGPIPSPHEQGVLVPYYLHTFERRKRRLDIENCLSEEIRGCSRRLGFKILGQLQIPDLLLAATGLTHDACNEHDKQSFRVGGGVKEIAARNSAPVVL